VTPCRLLADDGVGAAAGLAADEALMARYARSAPPAPPTLRLYTYASSCALVGRYQHLDAEVDLEACARTGTAVGRRQTGGGAIVMGADQLGVAFVTRAGEERAKEVLKRLSGAVVAGLAELGIDASFGGKNDVVTGGRKIAGLGLYLDGHGGLLFHASVLADLDVPFMLDVLRLPAAKLGRRGTRAVAERVTTVTRETGRRVAGVDLREPLARGFATALRLELEPGEPNAEERRRAELLEREKYAAETWLRQRSPQVDATATATVRTPGGLVRVYLAVQGTTIKSALFAGDYIEVPEPLARLESGLRWSRLDDADVRRVVARACDGDTGLGVPAETLAGAVLRAGRRALARAGAEPVRAAGSCYFPEVSRWS
jgi:lipoate-protein ligase A